jgi:hypothetical protein
MVNHDSRALLAFFPKKSSFRLIPYTIGNDTPDASQSISYDRLKNDFAHKGQLYTFFFEQPNGWAYQVEFRRGEPWQKGPDSIFIAPRSSRGHTYIKWKQEGSKWVVGEIAYVHP